MIDPIEHFIESPDLQAGVTRSFDRILKLLEAPESPRQCGECGNSFMAPGVVGLCDACAMERDKPKVEVYELGDGWPKIQAGKINTPGALHGKGLAMAEKLAPKMLGNRLLILAGDRGRGKTQIAVYCAWYRGQHSLVPGLYTRAYDMLESIIGFDREEKLDRYQRTPFLVVDECHRSDPKHLPLLESIVDDRYSNGKSTILIGNWSTMEAIQKGEEIDGEKLHGLGSSLTSRLNEHQANKTGGVVWCNWGSYRV